MAEGGIKADGSLAETLVSSAEHNVVGEAMANGKAPGLLMGQTEMAHGKGLLLWRQLPWRRALGVWWVRKVWTRRKRAGGGCTAPASAVDALAILTTRTSRVFEISIPAAAPEAS